MKKFTIVLLAPLMFGLSFTNCKKKESAVKTGISKGEIEIILPCSEFRSDDKFFRSFAFGESMDGNVAKQKALSNARTELAGSLNSTMKVVGDNYVKSSEFNNAEELLERFEQNARTVINQELRGVKTVCERMARVGDTRNFRYYIALELSGGDLFDKYYSSLTSDQSLKIDFNYERFKDTFNEEMAKFERR
jgi:predicted transcriptional regulator